MEVVSGFVGAIVLVGFLYFMYTKVMASKAKKMSGGSSGTGRNSPVDENER